MPSVFSAILLLAAMVCSSNTLPTRQLLSDDKEVDINQWFAPNLLKSLNLFPTSEVKTEAFHRFSEQAQEQDWRELVSRLLQSSAVKEQADTNSVDNRLRDILTNYNNVLAGLVGGPKNDKMEQGKVKQQGWADDIGNIGKDLGRIVDRYTSPSKEQAGDKDDQESRDAKGETTSFVDALSNKEASEQWQGYYANRYFPRNNEASEQWQKYWNANRYFPRNNEASEQWQKYWSQLRQPWQVPTKKEKEDMMQETVINKLAEALERE